MNFVAAKSIVQNGFQIAVGIELIFKPLLMVLFGKSGQ